MGREAVVECRWADQSASCKVLLESSELILRGALRRRVPLSAVEEVAAAGGELRFRVGEDQVSLALGADLAPRWAKAMTTPPPTLSKKLGITSATRLLLLGQAESPELRSAIEESAAVLSIQNTVGGAFPETDLIVISASNRVQLEDALASLLSKPSSSKAMSPSAKITPAKLLSIWIVYPKGGVGGLAESFVRETLRLRGFIDNKVVSVSAEWTALRFLQREA